MADGQSKGVEHTESLSDSLQGWAASPACWRGAIGSRGRVLFSTSTRPIFLDWLCRRHFMGIGQSGHADSLSSNQQHVLDLLLPSFDPQKHRGEGDSEVSAVVA